MSQPTHVPIESPTVARGVADYLRGVSDEMLDRCCRGGVVSPETAAAALAEQLRRQHKPQRIQRKRTKGWRLPANAVSVTRPGPYGNPYKAADYTRGGAPVTTAHIKHAVQAFRHYAIERAHHEPEWLAPLRGKDIACWCKVGEPCHGEVLLELANQ